MVGIAAAHTAVDMGYTGAYSETAVPSEIAVQDGTKAQPGTTLVPVQYLFAPQFSLDMHLPFSLS